MTRPICFWLAVCISSCLANAASQDPFWAFQSPEEPNLPKVKATDWPRTEIDRFILARLEAQELKPVPDADRRTLIRRAYFDLTGLPPRPEDVEAFLSDHSPNAFAAVVDRLLSSPQFGERWGRHWLDVARFAESSGGGRAILFPNAWRYRNYVIESFNRDKPYDRFIAEQIAGDLLPADNQKERRRQLIATAFLALGPTNFELQDKELLRMEVVDEQIDTMGRAVMGLTLGCARCHDHKFDPVPTRDYYALAGIFRSTKMLTPGNVSGFVEEPLPVDAKREKALQEHEAELKALESRIAQAEKELKQLNPDSQASQDPDQLPGIVLDNTEARLKGDWKESTHSPRYVGKGYIHDNNAAKGEKHAVFTPDLPRPGRYEVRVSYSSGGNRDSAVPVTVRHGRESEITRHIDQSKSPPIDDLFVSLGRFDFDRGQGGSVAISNRGTGQYVIVDAVQFIPVDRLEGDSKPHSVSEMDPKRRQAIAAAKEKLKQLRTELKSLKADAPPPRPVAMSVKEQPDPGDFHICKRGDVHNLGPKVSRGFLSALPAGQPDALPADESGRRQLAQWLTREDHPLTARVMVNRIWLHLFGEGLVRTPDNFGKMGRPPTHPELLDWLAIQFVNNDWSVKSLIRRIMLSRVYQLDSRSASAHAKSADPENRLYSKMNRQRLEAEVLRDTMLYISGRLNLNQAGKTLPDNLKSEFDYVYDSRRRSVYIPVFRNSLNPLFQVFDFADPNLVTGQRTTSTLPTQALYMMNSDFVMDQAKHAARRLLEHPGLTDSQRLHRAYCQTLGRPPRRDEETLTRQFLNQTATAGSSEQTPQTVAAWARVYQTLFACLDFRYRY